MPKPGMAVDRDIDEAELDILEIEPRKVQRLRKDILLTASKLGRAEARFLVDTYYGFQKQRMMTAGQYRDLIKNEEPYEIMAYMLDEMRVLEAQIKRALKRYADSSPVGEWAQTNMGIGPVIAAGLLAHIDIEKAPTAGHIWAFAGLDPTKEWEKGQKRPWNARLKVVCWKAGQSFVKVSNRPDAFYGHIYKARKEHEQTRNAAKEYADQAREKLKKFKIGKDTEAYKWYSDGMLPPAHIQARAERYAVKIFLSHLHHVMFWHRYGKEPPFPFAIERLGHAHLINVPRFKPPLIEGKKKEVKKPKIKP